MKNPRYEWDSTSLYALDTRTGEEVVYAQYGQVTIREATVEDIKRRIFKTDGMKKIIKLVMKTSGVTRKQAESHAEQRLRKAFKKREKDFFGIEYVIEVCGEFVAYAEITSYGYEPKIDEGQKLRKVFVGGKSYKDEDTFAGVEFFFVNKKIEEKYLSQICIALGYMCDAYGFFDHLDLIKLSISKDFQTKESVRQIQIYGTIFDFAAR